MIINSFKGQYRFLSNFYPAEVMFGGERYSTVEHAYQAAKTLDPRMREKIRTNLWTPDAKRIGRSLKLRPGWNQMRVRVMYALLLQKFRCGELAYLLMQTYPAQLVEGNTWGDIFWGVSCGVGQNMLGKLLMKVREDINVF